MSADNPAPKDPPLTYTLVLTEREYAELMMLAMRYGTSIDRDGIGTSASFRRAVANPLRTLTLPTPEQWGSWAPGRFTPEHEGGAA